MLEVELFKGNNFISYATENTENVYGETNPAYLWEGQIIGDSSPDAAVESLVEGKEYFFKGSQFTRGGTLNLNAGYPKQITEMWDVPSGWT